MKIVFLEIEGVLVNRSSRNTARLLQADSVAFLPCVRALNLVTDTTGAKIVITAEWRSMGLGWLKPKLKDWGITGEVVDVTPSPSISKANEPLEPRRGMEDERQLQGESETHLPLWRSLRA